MRLNQFRRQATPLCLIKLLLSLSLFCVRLKLLSIWIQSLHGDVALSGCRAFPSFYRAFVSSHLHFSSALLLRAKLVIVRITIVYGPVVPGRLTSGEKHRHIGDCKREYSSSHRIGVNVKTVNPGPTLG